MNIFLVFSFFSALVLAVVCGLSEFLFTFILSSYFSKSHHISSSYLMLSNSGIKISFSPTFFLIVTSFLVISNLLSSYLVSLFSWLLTGKFITSLARYVIQTDPFTTSRHTSINDRLFREPQVLSSQVILPFFFAFSRLIIVLVFVVLIFLSRTFDYNSISDHFRLFVLFSLFVLLLYMGSSLLSWKLIQSSTLTRHRTAHDLELLLSNRRSLPAFLRIDVLHRSLRSFVRVSFQESLVYTSSSIAKGLVEPLLLASVFLLSLRATSSAYSSSALSGQGQTLFVVIAFVRLFPYVNQALNSILTSFVRSGPIISLLRQYFFHSFPQMRAQRTQLDHLSTSLSHSSLFGVILPDLTPVYFRICTCSPLSIGSIESVFAAPSSLLLMAPSGTGKSTLLDSISGLRPGLIDPNSYFTDHSAFVVTGQPFFFLASTDHILRSSELNFQRLQKMELYHKLFVVLNLSSIPAGIAPQLLSTGQQQRLFFVSHFSSLLLNSSGKPLLLLLDETFSAIEQNIEESVLSLILEFSSTSFIHVTHRRTSFLYDFEIVPV
jgi:energy-coupling factor transporter ATP-binding protein EcfA2